MPVTPTADRYVPQLPFTFGATPRVENGTTKPHAKLTIMKGSAVDVAAAATAKKRQCRMGPGIPVQFRPIDVDPKPMERSKLMDLGYVVQKSRDTLKCMSSSLVNQLPAEAVRTLGIERAFEELGEAIASDVTLGMKDSFTRGVAQGKWLEAGPQTRVEDAEKEVREVRAAFYELQTSYRELHTRNAQLLADNAHLKASMQTMGSESDSQKSWTSPVQDLFNVPLETVSDELDLSELMDCIFDSESEGLLKSATDSQVITMLGDYVDSLPTPNNSPIAPHRQCATLSC